MHSPVDYTNSPVERLSTAELRVMIHSNFGGHGGGARLARALGVSHATASLIRSGSRRASLVKVAAHFGYVADGIGCWKRSGDIDPRDVGYVNWSSGTARDQLVDGLRDGKTYEQIAARLGVPRHRVKGAAYRLRADTSLSLRTPGGQNG